MLVRKDLRPPSLVVATDRTFVSLFKQKSVITYEYPVTWKKGDEPYYPMNDDRNNELYGKYRELADRETNVIFGGRLGQYRYYDMHQVVDEALKATERELTEV